METKELKIQAQLFNEMIADSRENNKRTLTLNKTALNKYLAEELGGLENTQIRITHKNSAINHNPTRRDSKFFQAYKAK